jgi:hypothetical protein
MNANVYIAALPRSGATLLGMMLNQHQDGFYMGESFFWGKFIPGTSKCSCGDSNCVTLMNVWERVNGVPEIMKISETCAILDDLPESGKQIFIDNTLLQAIESSCRGFDLLANVFREETSKRVLVDSSSNIRLAQRLMQAHQWKIILLIRDPRGIMYSQKKADVRHGITKPLSRQVHSLVDFANNAQAMIGMSNVLFVKYEELCSQPVIELEKISDFLGINFDMRMLRFRADSGHIVMGNRMRLGGSEKIVEDLSWISGLSLTERGVIYDNPGLVSLYNNFGYQLVS